MVSYLAAIGVCFLILFPAIWIGALALLTYYALTKVQPAVGRLAPVVVGLFLSVLAPIISPFSLLINAGIMAMGVLTPFMPAERYFPNQYLDRILFLGSVVAVSGRLICGLTLTFGGFGGGAGSPVFQLLGSITSSDAGFLIMSSIALYLEMVLISALIFGAIFVVIATFRKIAGR